MLQPGLLSSRSLELDWFSSSALPLRAQQQRQQCNHASAKSALMAVAVVATLMAVAVVPMEVGGPTSSEDRLSYALRMAMLVVGGRCGGQVRTVGPLPLVGGGRGVGAI